MSVPAETPKPPPRYFDCGATPPPLLESRTRQIGGGLPTSIALCSDCARKNDEGRSS